MNFDDLFVPRNETAHDPLLQRSADIKPSDRPGPFNGKVAAGAFSDGSGTVWMTPNQDWMVNGVSANILGGPSYITPARHTTFVFHAHPCTDCRVSFGRTFGIWIGNVHRIWSGAMYEEKKKVGYQQALMLQQCVDCLHLLPTGPDTVIVLATHIQRLALEIAGYITWLNILIPRLSEPRFCATSILDILSCLMNDVTVAQELFWVSVPYWYVQALTPRVRIWRVVECTRPTNLSFEIAELQVIAQSSDVTNILHAPGQWQPVMLCHVANILCKMRLPPLNSSPTTASDIHTAKRVKLDIAPAVLSGSRPKKKAHHGARPKKKTVQLAIDMPPGQPHPSHAYAPPTNATVPSIWERALQHISTLPLLAVSSQYFFPPHICWNLHVETPRLAGMSIISSELGSFVWRTALYGNYVIDKQPLQSMATAVQERHECVETVRRLFANTGELPSYDPLATVHISRWPIMVDIANSSCTLHRQLMWEAHEANWHCELYALDSALLGTDTWHEFNCWQRDALVGAVWDGISGLNLMPEWERDMPMFCWKGSEEAGWEDCQPALRAFMMVMSSWPGMPAELRSGHEVVASCDGVMGARRWRHDELVFLTEFCIHEGTRKLLNSKSGGLWASCQHMAGEYLARFSDPFEEESEEDFELQVRSLSERQRKCKVKFPTETESECKARTDGIVEAIENWMKHQNHRKKQEAQKASILPLTIPAKAQSATAFSMFKHDHPDKPAVEVIEMDGVWKGNIGRWQQKAKEVFYNLPEDELTALEKRAEAINTANAQELSNLTLEAIRARHAAILPGVVTKMAKDWQTQTGWVGLYITGGVDQFEQLAARSIPIGVDTHGENFEEYLARKAGCDPSPLLMLVIVAAEVKMQGSADIEASDTTDPKDDAATMDASETTDHDVIKDPAHIKANETPDHEVASEIADKDEDGVDSEASETTDPMDATAIDAIETANRNRNVAEDATDIEASETPDPEDAVTIDTIETANRNVTNDITNVEVSETPSAMCLRMPPTLKRQIIHKDTAKTKKVKHIKTRKSKTGSSTNEVSETPECNVPEDITHIETSQILNKDMAKTKNVKHIKPGKSKTGSSTNGRRLQVPEGFVAQVSMHDCHATERSLGKDKTDGNRHDTKKAGATKRKGGRGTRKVMARGQT
ncbi:hypothetical protein A0H81_10633 [Grifola frondosa]|uniref:Uncharacterized protein n=1 Tax=Grifola frondosa TaxID=5627 RepID=A0A1C7LY30_GRIFR|nr:hypothetical protein A0H81_10633 [Grifola frondosa]